MTGGASDEQGLIHPVPRIAPLDVADFTDEQAGLVGDWTHLVFSRVLVRHPAMYRAFLPFIDQAIRGSILPPRDREIIVLRMLALCGDTYEMCHHVDIARSAGMSDAEIADAQAGEGVTLSVFDTALAGAAEELHRDSCISDNSWALLGTRYSAQQLMETVFLAGCYAVMAMLTRSFAIPLEDGAQDFEKIAALRDYT